MLQNFLSMKDFKFFRTHSPLSFDRILILTLPRMPPVYGLIALSPVFPVLLMVGLFMCVKAATPAAIATPPCSMRVLLLNWLS